jgi:hypothetical protein
MNYEIINVEQDSSNKYKTQVIINNETMESFFFFFDSYPSQEQVNESVGDYIQSLVKPLPSTISARQIRLWLLQNNISLQMISDVINGISDPYQKEYISIEWEYAPYIERNHPMLVPLAIALGLTEEDINRAFIEASSI